MGLLDGVGKFRLRSNFAEKGEECLSVERLVGRLFLPARGRAGCHQVASCGAGNNSIMGHGECAACNARSARRQNAYCSGTGRKGFAFSITAISVDERRMRA